MKSDALARIVVVIPSLLTADKLRQSGALNRLEEVFHVEYLYAEKPASTTDMQFFQVLAPASLRTRLKVFLDVHFWYHELCVHMRRKKMPWGKSFKMSVLKPYQRLLHRIAALPLLSNFVSWLDRSIVFPSDDTFEHYLRHVNPALVIYPGSAMDSYSHFVVRTAKKIGIPTLMIVSHWDYFSKKGLMRICPSKVYVWGDDMLRLAHRANNLEQDVLRIIGAPYFERYLNSTDQERTNARARLGFDSNWKILLFAGTSTPFDEITVLKRLSEHLKLSGQSTTWLLYRPHPRAWARQTQWQGDIQTLFNVLVDNGPEGAANAQRDVDLMRSIDGIISPFSTMILEAALSGRPAFCIGFDDGVNSWDFSEANHTEHLAILSGRSWLRVCVNESRLENDFEEYIRWLETPGLSDVVLKDIHKTVYFDKNTYAERLVTAILTDFPLAKPGALDSALAARNHPDAEKR